jgi:hypothetical protein
MARRVNSELLLAGSLPADSTETDLEGAPAWFVKPECVRFEVRGG